MNTTPPWTAGEVQKLDELVALATPKRAIIAAFPDKSWWDTHQRAKVRASNCRRSAPQIWEVAKAIARGTRPFPPDSQHWHEDDWTTLIAYVQAAEQRADKLSRLPREDDASCASPEVERRTTLGEDRPAQRKFRKAVLGNYHHRCCITNYSEVCSLEAAHIVPYSYNPCFDVTNGLALRIDLHRLFDAGLITIDPQAMRLIVSRRVSCPQYRALDSASTSCGSVRAPPLPEALAWHARNVFTA